MAIPDYQTIMLPLLKFAADKKEHTSRESVDYISDLFKLTEFDRKESIQSGTQPVIDNRVGWARTYLKKAGLIEQPKRSIFRITNLGLSVIESNPSKIDAKFLRKYPSFLEFQNLKKDKDGPPILEPDNDISQTP